MKKELTLRWTKTKPLTRQGRGKEEETASVASLFVLFKFKRGSGVIPWQSYPKMIDKR